MAQWVEENNPPPQIKWMMDCFEQMLKDNNTDDGTNLCRQAGVNVWAWSGRITEEEMRKVLKFHGYVN